jgi:hypothetical protein
MQLPHHSLKYVEKRIEPSDGTIKLVACIENMGLNMKGP